MKIRRNIASIPVRSAQETWCDIVDLVTGPDTVNRDQFEIAASIMESLVADEQPTSVPIVIKGAGPRVVIYCLYNEDALDAGPKLDRLVSNPTAGDWCATAPCESEDVDWMNDYLKQRAPRITVHSADEERCGKDETEKNAGNFDIDWGVLGKR